MKMKNKKKITEREEKIGKNITQQDSSALKEDHTAICMIDPGK